MDSSRENIAGILDRAAQHIGQLESEANKGPDAEERAKLAERRTEVAEERVEVAEKRTEVAEMSAEVERTSRKARPQP